MIIIIGAGLSGLLTAYRLKKEGIPFKILEARNRIGGRINTVYGTDNTPVEMDATWFGNQHKHLRSLLEELGIEYFEQCMDGTVFFQPFSTSAAESIQIPSQPKPNNEIEEIKWLNYADINTVSAVDKIIFDFLKVIGELR
jgi:monoamine oxidase